VISISKLALAAKKGKKEILSPSTMLRKINKLQLQILVYWANHRSQQAQNCSNIHGLDIWRAFK